MWRSEVTLGISSKYCFSCTFELVNHKQRWLHVRGWFLIVWYFLLNFILLALYWVSIQTVKKLKLRPPEWLGWPHLLLFVRQIVMCVLHRAVPIVNTCSLLKTLINVFKWYDIKQYEYIMHTQRVFCQVYLSDFKFIFSFAIHADV